MADGWFELTVVVPQGYGDAVANFLIENDAPGIRLEEQGEQTLLTAYFSNDPPVASLNRFCADIGCGSSSDPTVGIRVQRIAEEDWAHSWKLHFQPQLVGDRLYVCPSWACTPPPGRVAVVIDPGMAFGTGQHASTRGCLQLLECATRKRQVTRALDVGTGSGVLAIALAKLGVGDVWAVDTDPSARAIAAANAAANGVDASIQIASSLDDVPGTFNLIAANLFANLLQQLAPQLDRSLRSSGLLICSGFLAADERAVCSAYSAFGLHVDDRHEENTWVTLAVSRRAPA